MYTLYCLPGSRATAARMVLAEGEIPHELRNIDITRDEHRSAEFLAVNPRGTIPALVDPNGNVICETIAIMLFLADRHRLAHLSPAHDDPQRGALLDWLVYHAVEVQEPVKRSFYAHRHAETPEGETRVRERADKTFNERWKLVDDHLRESGPFHLGSRFSLADIYLLVTASFSTPLARDEFPAIAECVRRSAARPRIAPVYAEHVAGLEGIRRIGVPR